LSLNGWSLKIALVPVLRVCQPAGSFAEGMGLISRRAGWTRAGRIPHLA
jgi:hypothetical protein